MKCQRVLDAVRDELNDPSEVWRTNGDLLDHFNDALLVLAMFRPDAVAITEPILLAQGTFQELPATGLRLIKITRNMGTAGTVPGRAITLGDMSALDALSPTWHAEAGTGTVYEYFYDPLTPKQFFVYPGVPASPAVYVEASYSHAPTPVTDAAATDLPVDDIYAPALREWMLYRAWGGDDESSPNYSTARDRRQTFFTMLGLKAPTDAAVSAKPARQPQ